MQGDEVIPFHNGGDVDSPKPDNKWIEAWKSGQPNGFFGRENPLLEHDAVRPHTEGMNTITREELDAKLAANVAEVKVISAETKAEVSAMRAETRAEMLALRSDNAVMFARLESQMAAMSAKIDASTAQVAGIEKGLEGKIDGLKTSMSTTQWVLGTLIAVAGLAATIVPLLKDSAPPQQPQIVVLQPGAAATPQPTPSKPIKQQPGGN